MDKKQKVSPLVFDTYLAIIKNSVGSKLFRNFYAKVSGEKTDVMRNGDLSCAFYVSSVLVLLQLINKVRATVDGTIKDLRLSGWKIIQKPRIGSVLVWEKIDFKNSESHKHIGFYIGSDKAVSNSDKLGSPVVHGWDFEGKRKVDQIFWHSKLNN